MGKTRNSKVGWPYSDRMKKRFGLLIWAALLAVKANAADLSLHWSEIEAAVQGKHATVVLTDGKKLRGNITAVETTALMIDPSGNIDRNRVAEIRIRKDRNKGRVIGTTIGTLMGGLGAAAGDVGSGGEKVAAVAVWAGVGYLIGYAVDRHEIVIKITPEIPAKL
jgi:uncharacterized protein YcfJ